MVQLPHLYVTTGKTIALNIWTFVGKVMSMLFDMLSRFVIAFLPRSKCLLISWLQSLSAVILEPKKIKSVTVYTFSSSNCQEVMGPVAMILVFWMLSFKPSFSLSSFTLILRLFHSSSLSAIRVLSFTYLRLLVYLWPILIPVCNSSSQAWLMMCSVYRLNKQGDSRQCCCIHFSKATIWPSNPTTGHIPGENHNAKRRMYPNVPCSTIYKIQDMEATWMSISRWMDKLLHVQRNITQP